MSDFTSINREEARSATKEQIRLLIHDPREDILLGLMDNPQFDEKDLCLLLLRKELSTSLLDLIASRDRWLHSYQVRHALVFHPHLSYQIGLRLVRELHPADLVQLTIAPSVAPALKHLAEEIVLTRVPQLPPAQKTILARRGSARLAGALLADGQPDVVPIVLESPFLNEGQVLRVLARINAPGRVVGAIASNGRWTQHYSI